MKGLVFTVKCRSLGSVQYIKKSAEQITIAILRPKLSKETPLSNGIDSLITRGWMKMINWVDNVRGVTRHYFWLSVLVEGEIITGEAVIDAPSMPKAIEKAEYWLRAILTDPKILDIGITDSDDDFYALKTDVLLEEYYQQ